jgi:hypothetical protein
LYVTGYHGSNFWGLWKFNGSGWERKKFYCYTIDFTPDEPLWLLGKSQSPYKPQQWRVYFQRVNGGMFRETGALNNIIEDATIGDLSWRFQPGEYESAMLDGGMQYDADNDIPIMDTLKID